MNYQEFLAKKTHATGSYGFETIWMPESAFDFQENIINKAIRKGRIVEMYSNPGEVVLTPFMGVGSEVYSPVSMGRKAIGIELKDSYFKQARINLEMASKRFDEGIVFKQDMLFSDVEELADESI